MMRNRVLAAAIAVLAAGLAVATGTAGAQESDAAITCTNSASGASWHIKIDYRGATVDSNPARMTRTEISWFDPKDGGNYTLDRTSGDLTISAASSTGGYFRYGRCTLGKSR